MRRSIVLVAVAAGLATALAAPAAAFPLTTCTLELASVDAGGTTIDAATGGTADAGQADPLEVAPDGAVAWSGTTGGQTITNWAVGVSIYGIPTPIGASDTDAADPEAEGRVGVGANLPFEIVGLYFVSGSIRGDGGSCEGSGWIRVVGDPIGTLPWLAAVALVVLGVLGLLGSIVRPHPWRGLFAGLLLGVGLPVLLVLHSVAPLGEWTVLGFLLGALVIGFLLGAVPVGGRAGPAAADT